MESASIWASSRHFADVLVVILIILFGCCQLLDILIHFYYSMSYAQQLHKSFHCLVTPVSTFSRALFRHFHFIIDENKTLIYSDLLSLIGLVLTNAKGIPKSLKHNAILILQYCHFADGCHHSQHLGVWRLWSFLLLMSNPVICMYDSVFPH